MAGLGLAAYACGPMPNWQARMGGFPAASSSSAAPAPGKMTAEQRVEAWKAGLAPELRAKVTQERKGAFLYATYTVEPAPGDTADSYEEGILATDDGVLGFANQEPQEVARDIDGDGKDDLLTEQRAQGTLNAVYVIVSGPEGPRQIQVPWPQEAMRMMEAEWTERDGKVAVRIGYSTSPGNDQGGSETSVWDGGTLVSVQSPPQRRDAPEAPPAPLRPGPGEMVVCNFEEEATEENPVGGSRFELKIKSGRVHSAQASVFTRAGVASGQPKQTGQPVVEGEWFELPMEINWPGGLTDRVSSTYRIRIQGSSLELDEGGDAAQQGTCVVQKATRR